MKYSIWFFALLIFSFAGAEELPCTTCAVTSLHSLSDDLDLASVDADPKGKDPKEIQLLYMHLKELDTSTRLGCLEAYESDSAMPFRSVSFFDRFGYEVSLVTGKWALLDLEKGLVYLTLDNETIANYGDVIDDPFLALRTKVGGRCHKMALDTSWVNLAQFVAFSQPLKCPFVLSSGMSNPGSCCANSEGANSATIAIANADPHFCYEIPHFVLKTTSGAEKIWWQIARDPEFSFVIPNFEGEQEYEETLRLDLLTDTFFSNGQEYYFRAKVMHDGRWSQWSAPYAFHITKPEAVGQVCFERMSDNAYEISWKGAKQKGVRYHVFASNARDFIPSIYADKQVNGCLNGTVESEANNNCVCITEANAISIDGTYAYYRIVAEQHGHYSVPSSLVYIYDRGLTHPRSLLQAAPDGSVTRKLFPSSYSTYPCKDLILSKTAGNAFVANGVGNIADLGYPIQTQMTAKRWEAMVPYFLPENHPIKEKLDRIFAERVTANARTMKNAGFLTPLPRRASKTIVTKHPDLPGYFIKCFTDDQKGVDDWKKLKNRIDGAILLKKAIEHYKYQAIFKVPQKWIYPLPEGASPAGKASRKHFILIAEDSNILDKDDNYAAWKGAPMTKEKVKAIFTLIREEGLCDSVFAFNIPFTKDDGRMAFIDTERWHCWPIKYHYLQPYFSKPMEKYWLSLVKTYGQKKQ